jgi:hypothetical protein
MSVSLKQAYNSKTDFFLLKFGITNIAFEVLTAAAVISTIFWSVTLRPKTDEVRKLHNEESHNLYSSPNIIRMIKSRRMRWAGHVARMGRRGIHIGYWRESQKERGHCKDQAVGGWAILKYILERQDGMVWTGSIRRVP